LARQLALPFGVRAAFSRDDFVAAPSNEAALHFVDKWPDWPVRAAALYGPSGSGKSHLTEVWCTASGGKAIAAKDLSPESIMGLPPNIAVEGIDAAGALSDEHALALLALFERPAGTLLLTGRSEPSLWPTPIGDLTSRFLALLAFPLWAPDDVLLYNIARKLFADRQLEVPETVIRRLLLGLQRTPAAVADFVARLDAKALAERRTVTERMVLELLDGEGES
jgi:chromosomal replication initiation ATPase DnaA